MARVGRFGRQPRSAPSLTSTIISIARQFAQQEDDNIMSAWQKGGTFHGSPVKDKDVLGWWKKRLDGVDKLDPLHDTYSNAVTQLDYSIHESKMTAGYAQGKKTDAQMVQFFMGWSKKVPKNSEFYRVLLRDAGQYMRNAKASNAAGAAKAKELRYQRLQADTREGKEAAGEYIIDTFRRIAQSGYADGAIAAAISAPGSGSDLTDFDPSDPETMLKLLKVITQEGVRPAGPGTGPAAGPTADQPVGTGKFAGNKDVIYHDDDGKGVTGVDIMARLNKLDPSFKPGTPLDVNYATGLLERQIHGLNERIQRATETGHMQDVASLQKSKSYVALLNREVAAWPIQKAYQDLRTTFDQTKNDPTASPAAVLKAFNEYSSGLIALSRDRRVAADDNLRARLVAEVQGDGKMPTLAESFTGLQNGAFDPTSAKDSINTKQHMDFLRGQVEAVRTGAAVWTYGTTGGDGVFTPQAGGREIGAARLDAVQAGGQNMKTITVADPRGGVPIQMAVTATPVYATAKDPLTGGKLAALNGNPVAYAYDVPKGNSSVTVYGFETKDKGFVFSQDPPWDESLRQTNVSSGGNHIEVDMSPIVAKIVPTDRAARDALLYKNQDFQNGFTVEGAKAAGARSAAAAQGQMVFDPQKALLFTDTRAMTGGSDPHTDFTSLTLATLMADPEGKSIISDLGRNPAFNRQLQDDNLTYAGVQKDANGQWIAGTGDPNKLAAAQVQTAIASLVNDLPKFLDAAAKSWNRTTTGTTFPNGAEGQHGVITSNLLGDWQDGKLLPSDRIRDTQFTALANTFIKGTNNFYRPSRAEQADLTIKTTGVIKVPSTTGPAAGPNAAPIVGNAQVGAVAMPTQKGATAPQQGPAAPYPGGPAAGPNAGYYGPPTSSQPPGRGK